MTTPHVGQARQQLLLPEAIGLVLASLPAQRMRDQAGIVNAFARLSMASKHTLIETGKVVLRLCHHHHPPPHQLLLPSSAASPQPSSRPHPLHWLHVHTMERRTTLCVRWAIAFGENVLPPMRFSSSSYCSSSSTSLSVRGFMDMYQHGFRSKLALAREVNPMCQFTFHIVTRWTPCTSAVFHAERAKKTGGELAVHKFICLKDAPDALLFLQRWAHMQKQNHGPQATCLMECGPATENNGPTVRKWIIDLDGKLEDLQSLGFLTPGEPCGEEVRGVLWAKPSHPVC